MKERDTPMETDIKGCSLLFKGCSKCPHRKNEIDACQRQRPAGGGVVGGRSARQGSGHSPSGKEHAPGRQMVAKALGIWLPSG